VNPDVPLSLKPPRLVVSSLELYTTVLSLRPINSRHKDVGQIRLVATKSMK
jgi:hypothetical protein